MEPASQPTAPGEDYNFIVNPEKPPKRSPLAGNDKKSFIIKVVFLVGGAVLVMVVIAFIINLMFGGKSIGTIISLTQTEQEIVRLSDLEKDAISQEVKNSAVNTGLVIKSHQQKWLAYLKKQGKELKKEELSLKKDPKTDVKLKRATQTSVFDATYTGVMRSQLTAYADMIKSAYNGTSSKKNRTLLNEQYKDVAYLLKQWPTPAASSGR